MKNISARMIVAFGASLWLSSGCDDVLEACQSCPEKGGGALSVAGDPRLDHSLEAAVRLAQQHSAASRRLSEAMRGALRAYGVDQGETVLSTASAAMLWEAAQIDLGRTDLEVSIAREEAVCSTDAASLVDILLACQNHLGCYVSDECRRARLAMPKMLCAGLCTGACNTVCQGACLSPSVSDGSNCDGPCLGACATLVPRSCAGTCLGTCAGTCSSLSQDNRCQGSCVGECTGACVETGVQLCSGVCHGRCGFTSDESCPAPGACRGRCDGDACLGSCRGLVEPVACDLKYCSDPGDATGLSQCRAAVRDLSATHIECRGGRATISPRFKEILPPPDAFAVLDRLRILEDALDVALEVEAWAKLVGLGVDTAAELDFPWLGQVSEGVGSSTEKVDLGAAAVPKDLASAPAWALKLRVFALSQEGAAKDFGVVAGAATCVPQAFQFAFQDLDKILPVVVDKSGNVSAERPPGSLLALVDTAEAMTAPLQVK